MDTIVVFTGKNLKSMFENGGSGDWVINEESLKKCSYIVATANTRASFSKHATTGHGHAFLIGKVSGLKQAHGNSGRKIIQFSEYAEINVEDAWKGQRNPVRYTSLTEFGLSPDDIQWQPFPMDFVKEMDHTPELTIEEAKRGIAKKLGIDIGCIEIVIRA